MLNAYTHTETFQPSQAAAGAAPQRRKEANGSTAQLNKKKKKAKQSERFLFPPNPSQRPFTSRILSVVSPLPAFCLSSLVSDPSQTDRSCQTIDVFISLGRDPVLASELCLCLPCVRVAVSHFFFKISDVFIRLSCDLGRNRGLRKEWEFPLPCPRLRGRGSVALTPSAGGGPPFNGPSRPHSAPNPFFLSRATRLILPVLVCSVSGLKMNFLHSSDRNPPL